MSQSQLLANRLSEVLLNGRWIANTNFKLIIESINFQQATKKVANLNTIAALTFHVNYYVGGLLNVLKGGKLEIKDQFSFDMPPIKSEEDWQSLIKLFLKNAEAFIQAVEQLPDSKLQETFVDEKYGTYQRNIEGVVEHSYYHLGQISLIKKLLSFHFSN